MLQSNSFNIPENQYNVNILSDQLVEGRSSYTSLFGIITGDAGIMAAKANALSKCPGADTLINMEVDYECFNFLYIYFEYTTIVKGIPVKTEINPDPGETWYKKARLFTFDKNECLKRLKKAIEFNIKLKERAKKDKSFKEFWDDEDFKKIVD